MLKVSILVALYNHERFIGQAIQSVVDQTYQNWELIIWDDGSQDESLKIAKEYESQHPGRIKVFSHPGGKNLGQEKTRNFAAQKATGEWVCLLDSDDLYHPQKLEWLVPLATGAVGLVYGKADVILESTSQVVPSGVEKYAQGKVFEDLIYDNFIAAGSTIFHRKFLEIGFDSSLKTCGEYPLWLQIASKSEVAFCSQVVCWWRSHGENLGTKLSLTAKKELVDLCERFLSDKQYIVYKKSIHKAYIKKLYDYANELYLNMELKELKKVCSEILSAQEIPGNIKIKTFLLQMSSQLGVKPNLVLSKIKRSVWKFRNPQAKSAR